MLFMPCVCHVFASVCCCRVVTCWERADLMALVCDVLLCFCHFPMWYPESGVVLDCIVSESLPSFLLRYTLLAKYVPKLLPLLKHKECLAHIVAS